MCLNIEQQKDLLLYPGVGVGEVPLPFKDPREI